MADLDVQPKSSRPWWMWLLIALVALALIFFLFRSCNRTEETEVETTTTETTAAAIFNDEGWDNVNLAAPAVAYDEITDKDIDVRGNDDYAVYSFDETICRTAG